jgi:hypothetical protein
MKTGNYALHLTANEESCPVIQHSTYHALQREQPMLFTNQNLDLVPWSRFGARHEKGTPEHLDLKYSTQFFGDVNYAC